MVSNILEQINVNHRSGKTTNIVNQVYFTISLLGIKKSSNCPGWLGGCSDRLNKKRKNVLVQKRSPYGIYGFFFYKECFGRFNPFSQGLLLRFHSLATQGQTPGQYCKDQLGHFRRGYSTSSCHLIFQAMDLVRVESSLRSET